MFRAPAALPPWLECASSMTIAKRRSRCWLPMSSRMNGNFWTVVMMIFLPLSMNPVLSTQLGTRHRAGIGVTEETDAIAVIVSEETGAISLAVGGKIERDLTVEQLRERIGGLLRRYVPPSTLPTPITNGGEELASSEESSERIPLARSAESRVNPRSDR